MPGFISCSKTLLDKEENFPNAQTKEGFDSNAYKLMEKADYDFNNPVVLGKGSGGGNLLPQQNAEEDSRLRRSSRSPKSGLCYPPVQLIRISG